jgi:hypothetical protein
MMFQGSFGTNIAHQIRHRALHVGCYATIWNAECADKLLSVKWRPIPKLPPSIGKLRKIKCKQ